MLRNLDALTRFVAVVDEGTMRRAAEKVGVTQAALTRSIKLLEEAVDAPLFERRGRGMTLTLFGERVLEQARQLLREAQVAEAEILAHRDGERGTIRLSAAPVWMTSILPAVIARLHKEYPRLGFELEARNYSDAVQRLKTGEIDAFFGGFQRLESLPSFLQRMPLFPARLLVMSRQDHPLQGGAGITAADLLDFPWVSFQSDVAYLDAINDAIYVATGQTVVASIHCDSMLTALELLRQGDYLALLPVSFLSSAHGTGLAAVLTDMDEITFQSGPIFRRSLRTNAAFSRLLELSAAHIAKAGLNK